jgi:hypothetical protein
MQDIRATNILNGLQWEAQLWRLRKLKISGMAHLPSISGCWPAMAISMSFAMISNGIAGASTLFEAKVARQESQEHENLRLSVY